MRPIAPAILPFLLALTTAACSVISLDLTPRVRPLEEETVEGEGDAKIVLVDISGVLSDDAGAPLVALGAPPPHVPLLVRLREELTKAASDPKVRALLVRINSPGGTVTASDIIYRELRLFTTQTKVPIVAAMMDVAASGGYYVALAADTIVAHPTTVTGSIGTIMISLNAEALLEKIGVSALTIKSGERKDMGSPFRRLTSEERAIFQSVIDHLHDQFLEKLVERRKLARAAAAALADGRVYTAEQALRHGLIDQIGYLHEAITLARKRAGVENARVVVYRRPREYRATYYARAAAGAPALETAVAQLLGLGAAGPRFLYLWWP